jgi:hypothetical protein
MQPNRRAWFAGILAAIGLKAQNWIPPVRTLTNTRMWGTTNLPTCPVCGMIGSEPNLPMPVGSPDGAFRGEVIPGARLFICTGCGCLYAGFTSTP